MSKGKLFDFSFFQGTSRTNYPYGKVLIDRVVSDISKNTNPSKYKPNDVGNVIYKADDERRVVMFVFDTCQVDIRREYRNYKYSVLSHCLPSHAGVLLSRLCNLAVNRYAKSFMRLNPNSLNTVACDQYDEDSDTIITMLKTTTWIISYYVGHTDNQGAYAEDLIDSMTRFDATMSAYKPDIVISLGDGASGHYLGRYQTYHTMPNKLNVMGRLLDVYTSSDHLEVMCRMVPVLDISKAVVGESTYTMASLLGYASRQIMTGILGCEPYSVTTGYNPSGSQPLFSSDDSQIKLISTVKAFDKMLAEAKKQPCVGIDTETRNLNRTRHNSILTIQIGWENKAYVVPLQHFETPFSPKELTYIFSELVKFFEYDNENNYHIYTNAVFDLNILRVLVGVRFFATPVWDIQAAEFALDENAKYLKNATGFGYYSLLNLSLQYGTDIYLTTPFSKEQRTTIHTSSLTDDVLAYCSYDVLVPYAIHKMQLKRAADIGYEAYRNFVITQLSDMLHVFSKMETAGVEVDIDYLLTLRNPDSPIAAEISKMESSILNTKEGQQANSVLLKQSGMPARGLFDNDRSSYTLFSLRKRQHLELLFFDVLGLVSDKTGKSGKKKIDAAFQTKYASNTIVSMYTKLVKAKKLANSYVKQFINFWNDSVDFREDNRVRPHFGMLGVVTGRTSASKPSLHQIPSRSELGKAIKRLFIAGEGKLYLKIDFSSHEVRNWGILSLDSEIANLFFHGLSLKRKYRNAPTPALKDRLVLEADVHRLNASFFFGVDIDKVSSDLRAAVKAVFFGFIYGLGITRMSGQIGKTVEETLELISMLADKYTVGFSWFDMIKQFAAKMLYVETPIGRRRNLFQYLVPKDTPSANALYGAADRRAVNSYIQGFSSDEAALAARLLERLVWAANNKARYSSGSAYKNIRVINMVHDSIEVEVGYDYLFLAIKMVDYATTGGVRKVIQNRCGFTLPIDLDTDFEVGADGRGMSKWDGSFAALKAAINKALVFQRDDLGRDIDVDETYKQIMSHYKDGPDWLVRQIETADQQVTA